MYNDIISVKKISEKYYLHIFWKVIFKSEILVQNSISLKTTQKSLTFQCLMQSSWEQNKCRKHSAKNAKNKINK